MRTSDRLHLAAGLALLSGCVLFPFATPPAVVQLGYGAGGRTPSGQPTQVQGAFQLRAGAYPLGLARNLESRPFDVGGGFCLDGDPDLVRGGYLDLVGQPLSTRLDGTPVRLGLHGQARLVYDPVIHRWGEGAAGQVSAELFGFHEGPFESHGGDSGFVGQAYGEAGVGLYLEGAYTWLPGRPYWTAGGGVQLRAPASAGIGYVWLWALLK